MFNANDNIVLGPYLGCDDADIEFIGIPLGDVILACGRSSLWQMESSVFLKQIGVQPAQG